MTQSDENRQHFVSSIFQFNLIFLIIFIAFIYKIHLNAKPFFYVWIFFIIFCFLNSKWIFSLNFLSFFFTLLCSWFSLFKKYFNEMFFFYSISVGCLRNQIVFMGLEMRWKWSITSWAIEVNEHFRVWWSWFEDKCRLKNVA